MNFACVLGHQAFEGLHQCFMSKERRIVCWVQLVIGCTSWEAPKNIKRLYISSKRTPKKKKNPKKTCSSEIVDYKKNKKQKFYYKERRKRKGIKNKRQITAVNVNSSSSAAQLYCVCVFETDSLNADATSCPVEHNLPMFT